MSDDEFTLQSAARANAAGRLAEWVEGFLASPGSDNEVLAAALLFDGRCWAGPVLLPLDDLRPLAGPDDDEVLVPIDEDEWEGDIDDMVESLDDGWAPPPLIVSCRVDGFHLEDGNHRHETMVRAGRTHGWAVVAFDTDDDRQRFLATRPTRTGAGQP